MSRPKQCWLSSDLTFEARAAGLIAADAEINRTPPGKGFYKRGYYLRENGREVFLANRRDDVVACLVILGSRRDAT